MTYLLDTNVCIRYLNGRSPAILRRIQGTPQDQIFVCSVVKYEPYFGALRTQNVLKTLKTQIDFLSRYKSLPFDDKAVAQASRIRAELTRKGKLIGLYDILIAAIALANRLTLVTHNTAEFQRVSRLLIEDWETDEIN